MRLRSRLSFIKEYPSLVIAALSILPLAPFARAQDTFNLTVDEIKILRVLNPGGNTPPDVKYDAAQHSLNFISMITVPTLPGVVSGTGTLKLNDPQPFKGFDLGDSISVFPSTSIMVRQTAMDNLKLASTVDNCDDRPDYTPGNYSCQISSLPVEATTPTLRRAYINIVIQLSFIRGSLDGRTIAARVYFNFTSPPKDKIVIVDGGVLPEPGTKVANGTRIPIFAALVYQLQTKDRGEVFLELSDNQGHFFAYSPSRRIGAGLGSLGFKGDSPVFIGKGDYLVLEIPAGTEKVILNSSSTVGWHRVRATR